MTAQPIDSDAARAAYLVAEAAYVDAFRARDAAHGELRLALKAARVTGSFVKEKDPPGVVAARAAYLRAVDALNAAEAGAAAKARIVARRWRPTPAE